MSHSRLLITCVASCLAALACKKSAPPPVQPQANAKPASMVRIEDSCPVQVPATAVTVVNTKNGVAMFFTTMPSNVDEVRRRVGLLAKMDPVSVAPADEGPDVEPPPSVFGAPAKLVPMQAKAEDISDGASLVMTPLNPMDVEMLRAYAHNSAQRMRLGRCPADFMQPRRATGPEDAGSPPSGRLG
jgi:hypothetical protein